MTTTNVTLKKKREEANRLVGEISNLKLDAKTLKLEVEQILKNSKVGFSEFNKLNDSLKKINKNTEEAIVGFRKEKDKIRTMLSQANSFYEKKFLPLSKKIDDNDNGFRAKINISNNELRELKKIKLDCSKQYDIINKFVADFKTKSRDLQTINNSIRRYGESSEKNKIKTDELKKDILASNAQIITLLSNVKKNAVESAKLEGIIKTNETYSKDFLSKIEKLHEESKEKRDAIQTVYEISHETGLSGEFGNRRNKLKLEVADWRKRIFWTSLILLTSILALFVCQLALYEWNIKDNNFDFNFYIRFLILSPVVYYLVFCSSQYNKALKLYDKYSFKTTLAMTIKSHIDLLVNEEKFSDVSSQQKVLDFVLEGFKKIYNEPYGEDDYKIKVKLANLKFDLQKDLIKTISKTKE